MDGNWLSIKNECEQKVLGSVNQEGPLKGSQNSKEKTKRIITSLPEIDLDNPAASAAGVSTQVISSLNSPTAVKSSSNDAQKSSSEPSSKKSFFKRHRKGLKVCGIVAGSIAAVLLVVYVAVAIYFFGHFWPKATIGDVDVSLMNATEAEAVLSECIEDYTLTVSGEGFSLQLDPAEAELSIDPAWVVAQALDDVNPWTWPVALSSAHDLSSNLAATYNDKGLADTVRKKVDTFNKDAKEPADATIEYDKAAGKFVVKPEVYGTALDPDAVVKAVDKALTSLTSTVKISDDQMKKPEVISSDKRLDKAASDANEMIKANFGLIMADTEIARVDPALISQWITLNKDLKASLSNKKLKAWVKETAAAYNTAGSERSYTRPDGKSFKVSGGVYGWKIDQSALLAAVKDAVAAGSKEDIKVPTSSEGETYNGAGSQDWGSRYCDIDLSEQHVRFYDESGSLIWEADCISGKPNGINDTPTGVYVLNAKQSPCKLTGYENGKKIYESTVQYWMPFDGNVIGLHDADWQPGFGGTMYKEGYGSHGCVNLPPQKAAQLYNIIQSGDVVVCHW